MTSRLTRLCPALLLCASCGSATLHPDGGTAGGGAGGGGGGGVSGKGGTGGTGGAGASGGSVGGTGGSVGGGTAGATGGTAGGTGGATGGTGGSGGVGGTGGRGGSAGGTGGRGGGSGSGGSGGSAGGTGGSAGGTGGRGGGSGSGGSGGTGGSAGGTGGTAPMPGTILWARSMSQSYPTGAIESGSGVLATGYFFSPIDVGNGTVLPVGASDTVLADFGVSDGHHIYSVAFGGSGEEYGFLNAVSSGTALINGVSYCNASGTPACTGNNLGQGTVQGGGGTGADGFIARWTPTAPAFVKRLVGPGEDKLIAAALGPSSGPNPTVYVGGFFDSGTVTLDGRAGYLPWGGDRDILIAQYNAFTGDYITSKTFASPSRDELSSIAFNGTSLFMAGHFGRSNTDSLTIGSKTLTCAGECDVWVGKFMPDATPIWATSFGGTMEDRGALVTFDAAGDVYLAGTIRDRVTFGTKTWMSSGGTDVFVAKLRGADGGVIWSTAFGDTGDDGPTNFVFDSKGDLVLLGTITGPIEAGAPFGGGGTDAFVVAFDPATGNRRWSKMIGGPGGDSGNSLSAGVDALYVTIGVGTTINVGTPIVGEANPLGLVLKMQP